MNSEVEEDKVLVELLSDKEHSKLKRRLKQRRSVHLYMSPSELERAKSSDIQKRQEAA